MLQIFLMIKFILTLFSLLVLFSSCSSTKKNTRDVAPAKNATKNTASTTINTKAKVFTKPLKINRNELVKYAKTFIGTPYKYGSASPSNGLDCSGFIMVVFAHFDVKTPRVSRDYTNEGTTINVAEAKAGDLILFTGSDNSTGIVGHIGIVTENGNMLTFISSTSGKNIGVVEAKLSGYWKTHFVKIIRLLE
jgi:cell wall-associated NlpC family hydrolase